jgi:hypothetical protein
MSLTTAQLVEPTANIVRIVSLKKGDVYKRLHQAYSGSEPEIRFGIVTDILHNGTEAAVTSLEYQPASTDGLKVELKTFSTTNAPAFFPAEPSEFETHLRDLGRTVDNALKTAREKVTALEHNATLIRRLKRQHVQAAASEVTTIVLPEGQAVEA